MRLITDLHLHSKYSRAVSKAMVIPELALWGERKGIQVLGTGDWTHPLWLKELKRDLEPAEPGLFKYKDSLTRFMLTVEISQIYKRGDKVRKVHNLIFAPSFKEVDKIRKKLDKIGNLSSDGRPILGLDSEELLKIVLDVSSECMLIPAHIWTPWFSMFGSRSGFDSVEECFGKLAKYIYAVETGLSSDPDNNWRIKDLDSRTLVSFGDAHSLPKIGREATVFDGELSYDSIVKAIKKGKVVETIEFFPEEGRYHVDGHRKCDFSCLPSETRRLKGKCPKCSQDLVVGVLSRVEDLASRKEGFKNVNRPPFRRIVPLQEVLSEVCGVGPNTKTVLKAYEEVLGKFGSEFEVLLNTPIADLGDELGVAIERMRKGDIHIAPGFDGEFGKVEIFSLDEKKKRDRQRSLF